MVFKEIYDKYVSVVYGYLSLRINDKYLIEDIIQDLFLDIYQSMEKINEIDNLKAYIIRAAHNKMVDKLRKQKNHLPIQEQINEQTTSLNSNLFSLELLSYLKEDERQIVYGLYIAGLHVKELAKMLKIPEGTVKRKCFEARKKLKEIIRRDGYNE